MIGFGGLPIQWHGSLHETAFYKFRQTMKIVAIWIGFSSSFLEADDDTTCLRWDTVASLF